MNRGFSPRQKGFQAKGKPDTDTLKRLMSYISKDYKIPFIIVLVLIVIGSIAGTIGSVFLKVLIDKYINPMLTEGANLFPELLKALFIMGSIYIAGILSTYLYNYIMVIIAQGILKKIRDNMFSHMQSLPIKYFDTHTHGEIMSHYTNDTDTLRQMLTQSIPQMFSSIITIVSVFVAMLLTSIPLTILVAFSVFFMLSVTKFIAGKSGNYFMKQQQSIGKVNGYIEEMVNGQKIIKVFCHERENKEFFDLINEELCENATSANKYANIFMPIMANLGTLQYVLVAIVGASLAINNITSLSVGGIVAFLQLSRSFTMPISQVSQQLNSIVMALSGAKRIFTLMDEKSEEDHGYVTLVNFKYQDGEIIETKDNTSLWAWKHPHSDGTTTYTKVEGHVELNDVDFSYVPEKLILKNISLEAKAGEKIAFVGSTGAGKTTITNLINRFYDIADGKIRYDGININKIKKSHLRKSLGIVLQDTHLFTGTVLENIRYGKLSATDEEVHEAAKLSNAHDFIMRLPDGYNTMLTGDGGSLSQGQRQLLAIARNAVLDPPVMILDEATSSIDTRTEIIVQKGMDMLMTGRTVFIVAHRLSTVKNSDSIMVLEKGEIIERGNHKELISQKGKYYQLFTGAFIME